MDLKDILNNFGGILKVADITRIVRLIEVDFGEKCYKHFVGFKIYEKYKSFWNLCIRGLREQLVQIKFCNDTHKIPPITTFCAYYENELLDLMVDDNAVFDGF